VQEKLVPEKKKMEDKRLIYIYEEWTEANMRIRGD